MTIRILASLVLAVFISTIAVAADKASYERLLAESTAAHRAARDAGGEWRDIRTLIREARRAATSGNYARATELLEEAKFQSEMGLQQAIENATAGNPAYLYQE